MKIVLSFYGTFQLFGSLTFIITAIIIIVFNFQSNEVLKAICLVSGVITSILEIYLYYISNKEKKRITTFAFMWVYRALMLINFYGNIKNSFVVVYFTVLFTIRGLWEGIKSVEDYKENLRKDYLKQQEKIQKL